MHNPFAQVKQPIQLTIEASDEQLGIIELRAEDFALAITRPIDRVSAQLIVIVDEAGAKELKSIIKKVAPKAKVRETKLEPIDWVRQVQKDFPPFRLERFFVHGTQDADKVPQNAMPLLIDAAAAFGTGEHETTAGCLLALLEEKQRRPQAPRILDMGCGTAILAIGAARLWKDASITACDNDAVAVEVSEVNVKANKVRALTFRSDGYRDRRLQKKQFDIVVANILARPLMRMARQAVQAVAPGGTLILSGLLNHQERMVLSAHAMQGLRLKKRLRRGRWSVLILKKA